MDLVKCPNCGEYYSPSYRTCPFCEENDERSRRRPRKRRITTRKKAQSARGGMIVVLVLVLALFGWYLFGDRLPSGEKVSDEPAAETVTPAPPAESADGTPDAVAAEPSADGESGNVGEPPAVVHVDASSLEMKTNVSGTLPKDSMTGYFDCSLKRTDSIRLIVVGTDVPVSAWRSENTDIVTVDEEGRLTLVKAGTTNVSATVGDATLTCIVRVR